MTKTDVNADFDRNRASQIASLVSMREDHQRRIADFESGAAQAAIDAEIMRRVEAGEIMMIGPDRYRTLTGWDANENFTVRKAANPGELSLIEPESGLDFVNGDFQGWFDRPEWHNLGKVDVGGLSDIDTVLDRSGLGFEVLQRPVRFLAEDGVDRMVPGQWVNYRSDDYAPLGVVGNIYAVRQNREGFAFLQDLVGDGSAKFASAFPLDGGKRCVISMKLPNGITVDAEGVADAIEMYLCWFNNHDGEGKLWCKVTPFRPRCRNTERLAFGNAVSSWGVRHTKNALDRLGVAREQLRLAGEFVDSFAAQQELLAHSAATMDDVIAVMDEVWEPAEQPSKRAATMAQHREDQLAGLWGHYSKELGRTKYAAERVFTDWFDHVAPRRAAEDGMAAARATAALVGYDDKNKNKVHAKLLQLAGGGTETE